VTRLRTGLSGVQILAHARASDYLFSGMSYRLWNPPPPTEYIREGRGVRFTTHLRLLPRLMRGGYLHSAYTPSWRAYGQLILPLIPVRRKRAQTAIPRAGYETRNSADEPRVFVLAAVMCHSCTAIRTVRQPWTVSLSGYNISRLPHSRARGIEMCARRGGSAVQVAE